MKKKDPESEQPLAHCGGSAWEDVVETREDVCGTTDDNVCW